jgi:restriction system protein
MATMWMIRAGRGGENVDEFIKEGCAAFGDDRKLGPIPVDVSKDDLLALYAKTYPGEKEGSRASWASQLLRFVSEIKIGDDVLTNDRERRRYILGKVKSSYQWLPQNAAGPHVRQVEWTHELSRDALSTATKNTLGSVLTIFKLNADAAKDLWAHAVSLGTLQPAPLKKSNIAEEEKDDEALGIIAADTFERADEFIEDQIDQIDWQQMQELVAGILRAMGYRTTISDLGPDRGVDVFASRDGLGLEEPRIFVEVKHRNKAIGAPEIRSFLGGRKPGDKCLYVSTGGFSKDALYEADRASVAITLVNLPRLRKLVVDFYEKLDPETRALVPLRRLYWPAVNIG